MSNLYQLSFYSLAAQQAVEHWLHRSGKRRKTTAKTSQHSSVRQFIRAASWRSEPRDDTGEFDVVDGF